MRPLALMLPLLGAAVWWSVRRGVRPLRTLGQLLRARTPGGLAPVTVAGAPAEMDPLLEALNGLLLRIAALMESERRFTADAAHELRTPIAAIRAQAQVAQAEPDGALRQHALQAVLQGCDRAARLVEQLLTLSRMDSGATPPQSEVDLTRCTREVLASLAPTALARQQDLDFLATEPVTVFADPTLLAVLVRNLLDNAVRYSPNGATIRVAISSEPSRVCWGVDDSGPGLEAADLARLGERFFRVLGTGQDGSGMGWSIVHRIAVIQGATVTVGKSAALGGLAVRVEWPLRGLPGAGDQALR
jgi:two-component system sensor histidine kinase QseC